MEDLTGKQLGAYQIVAPLGEGGMAAVYKAYQPGMDRYVALKILPRHFASDPQFVARFEQEAKVLAQLQHPHILPVFDYGQVDGYTYIVMPFLQSGDLTDLLKGQPLSLAQTGRIISQIGDALDYAHSRGLVHRDVKPSNVLLDERGNCLLTDFGIAKIVEGSSKLTATGGIIGTPAYMSPEQGLAQKLDGRSDIYSLGIVLYELATGRVPYQAETPMAVVIKHMNDPLPPPRQVNPTLPETIERIIFKALAKQPENRYATAGEMVRALQAAIGEAGPDQALSNDDAATITATAGTTLEERSPKTISTRKWIFAAGALAIVLFIGVIVFFAVGNKRETETEAAIVQPVETIIETATVAVKATEQAEISNEVSPVAPAEAKVTVTPIASSPQTILYEENFESGKADGWLNVNAGEWVVFQNNGNTVYGVRDQPADLIPITFLENSALWQDYSVETEVMFESGELEQIYVTGRTGKGADCTGYRFGGNRYGISIFRLDPRATCQGETLAEVSNYPLVPNRLYKMKLEFEDAQIRAYIDDELVMTVEDSVYPRGGIALSAFQVKWAYFDNIQVAALERLAGNNTPPFTPTATINVDPTVYDNFNNPAFDGKLDTSLWRPSVTPPSYIEQQDGVLILSLKPKAGDIASLFAVENLKSNQFNFAETKILLSGEKTGQDGDIGLALMTTDKKGQNLIFLCVISRSPPIQMWCEVYGRGSGAEYLTKKIKTNYDVWHTVRIEMDPEINATFYIDGEQVGSYRPNDAEEIKGRAFTPRLEVWSPKRDGIEAHFDDVRIGQLSAFEATTPTDTPIPPTSTPPPASTEASIAVGTILFEEDFEDDKMQGIGFSAESGWKIAADETGNKVYEIDNRNGPNYKGFSFGMPEWKDYSVEYRARFLSSTGKQSEIGSHYRSDGNSSYVLVFSEAELYLAYEESEWTRLTTQFPHIERNVWYNVKADVQGEQIRVYLDNALLVNAKSSEVKQGEAMIFVGPDTYAQIDDVRVVALGE